ncbi:hypothetical protein K438DRAFT_1589111, partial [Mycena galopus ATCC 62051]
EIIPLEFGLAQNQWPEGFYGETEASWMREVEIHLPFAIWWLHAVVWVQGLEFMVRIQEQ